MNDQPQQETGEGSVGRLARVIAVLDPACFSIVMATGIVSLACWYVDASDPLLGTIARLLHWVNAPWFVLLLVLTAIRSVRHFGTLVKDLTDHRRAFGFFSMTAASAVLGGQFLQIAQAPYVAAGFWLFAAGSWFTLTYVIFTGLTVKQEKPSLREGLHGGWLLAVVATQSVSLLGSSLCDPFPHYRDFALFVSLTLWLGGGMLYAWIISLIFYRYCFEAVDVESMSPPYWINMGAMAISTFAGTNLISSAGQSQLFVPFLPFIQGVTLLCWSTATWWIPLLLALGFWRHVLARKPLVYDLRYWSMVFPLGMYSVGTHGVSNTLGLGFLNPVATTFACIALVAWLLTTVGLVRQMIA